MKRREFVSGLLGAAAAGARPLVARAQQDRVPVVGFLRVTSAPDSAHLAKALRQGLKEAGFVEGQNVRLEERYAENHRDRLPELARELAERKVALIVTDQAIHAVKAAAPNIPSIFVLGADPVGLGLVQSLSRPGGNITGIVFFSSQLGSKRIGLLRQIFPHASKLGVLAFTASPEDRTELAQVKSAAEGLGQQLVLADITRENEIDQAFETFAKAPVDAVLVGSGPFFRSHKQQIIGLAAQYRLPASYSLREYVDAGGLMSYGTSITNGYRQAGLYAGRILKGEKVAELPVMQSTTFELALNLKTAKTLGVSFPQSLLLSADEVIE